MSTLSITTRRLRLVIGDPGRQLTLGRQSTLRLSLPKQGPAGPAGPGVEIESYLAAANIGGHRAVGLNSSGEIVLATASGEIPAIGMIRDAVISGASATVYRSAKVGGFTGLIPGATYYLSDIGTAVLTPPAGGVLQVLGVAGSATELLADPGEPVAI